MKSFTYFKELKGENVCWMYPRLPLLMLFLYFCRSEVSFFILFYLKAFSLAVFVEKVCWWQIILLFLNLKAFLYRCLFFISWSIFSLTIKFSILSTFSQPLKVVFHCLLTTMDSDKKFPVTWIALSFYIICHFSPATFQIFVFSHQHFDYVSKHGFLWIYPFRGSLWSLNL